MDLSNIGAKLRGVVKNGILTRRGPRTLNNLGTGINGTRKLTSAAIVGGAIAGGILLGSIQSTVSNTGPFSEYGNIPQMSYDAVASGNYRTGTRDLGATGDLVFGLNSGRHGK